MGRRKNQHPFKRVSTLHLWTVTSGATNAKDRANFFSADPGPDLVAHGAALNHLGIKLGKSSQDTEVCVKNLHCPQIWECSPENYVF